MRRNDLGAAMPIVRPRRKDRFNLARLSIRAPAISSRACQWSRLRLDCAGAQSTGQARARRRYADEDLTDQIRGCARDCRCARADRDLGLVRAEPRQRLYSALRQLGCANGALLLMRFPVAATLLPELRP